MRFLKALIRAFLFLAAFLVLVTFGINYYLGYSGIKERLILQAEEAVSRPITAGKLYFVPWSGLHLQNAIMTDASRGISVELSALSLSTPTLFRMLINNKAWHGSMRIKKVFANNRLFLRNIKAELNKSEEMISINPFIAKILGGKIQGAMVIQKSNESDSFQNSTSAANCGVAPVLASSSTSCTLRGCAPEASSTSSAQANFKKSLRLPYQFSAEFFGIPLQESLAAVGIKMNSGVLQGTVNLTGTFGKPDSMKGTGTLDLVEAEVNSADYFGSLSRLFPVEELQILKLKEAKASYTIMADHFQINSARLQSDNLILTAQGNLSFSGETHLNAQLLLNEKLQRSLQGMISTSPSSEAGYQQLSFKINGSGTHLQTDFWNKVVGQQMQNNLGGLLQGLLNGALKH